MNHRHAVLTLCITGFLVVAMPVIADGRQLPATLAELAPRPELWPGPVTILADAEFTNGRAIRKGQIVRIEKVTPEGVTLEDGSMFFRLDAGQTDLFERVGALVRSLTPEQLVLKRTDLPGRPELWPERLPLQVGLTTEDGSQVAAGDELVLIGFCPDGRIKVAAVEQGFTLPVDPVWTDLFDRARERLLLDDADAVPYPYRTLESLLEPSSDGTTVSDLDYLVFYQGRDACPRATHYAPELADSARSRPPRRPVGYRLPQRRRLPGGESHPPREHGSDRSRGYARSRLHGDDPAAAGDRATD